jgi:2-polyprenyl-3-methyl-5-hydroxy-6-metoxy-1,4-benzoquinol methylase
MSTMTEPAIDPKALDAFVGRMVGDLGAAVNGALVILGDRLGIYRALAKHGPATSNEVADATALDERYLREWLAAQAASGYITYDSAKEAFSLSPEQSAVFADPDSPAAMTGGFYSVSAVYHAEPKIADCFRTGRGMGWAEHHNCLFCGTARFFRAGYEANLVQAWLPALDGVIPKLEAGAKVADIGCGHGSSTLIMARTFPASQFTGFDIHPGSIEAAQAHAEEEGITNVRFEVATAKDFPGSDYDLVTTFDALHDMGDPVGAARHVRQSLAPDGTWLVVEPMAGDSLAENLNPVGRVFYGFSTMICTPASRSQEVGLALGAQAGEKRLRGVVSEGGFSRFRRATETPFNLILEARP